MKDDVSGWDRSEKLRNRRQREEIPTKIGLLPHQELRVKESEGEADGRQQNEGMNKVKVTGLQVLLQNCFRL